MRLRRRRRERLPVEELLGVTFRDPKLLSQALTHRSYAHEASLETGETNERLEFLGDAVLDLVISDHLFRHYRDLDEGKLTRIRSYLVNMGSLAELAREMGLGEHLLLSRDERADGGAEKSSIVADALEALIGAVYLDQGLEAAREMVLRIFRDRLEEAASGDLDFDYKSQLQELTVKERGVLPRYRLREEGPDHCKVFHAVVYVGDRKMGSGSGSSKKEAEQAAARDALRRHKESGTGRGRSGRRKAGPTGAAGR
ncbi:ribonuclease III [Candidatus Solincola tengchongensis]|uniref:ribonuclease III n=1 Tax=Candidatus Solincola tengchongensis TaxID=2900693 RepID=UPI00257CC129|nr:ribonuclease III [Candidatus Solincola tengchongensis]